MTARFRVLIVCTANICRSPYVEARLRHELTQAGCIDVEIESGGTRALVGEPMAEESGELLRRAGVEPEPGFRAKQIIAPTIERSDLVLTMTREHRAQVLEIAPSALRRTLTLREFAGLLDADSAAASTADEVADRWRRAVSAAVAQRSAHPLLVNSEGADLADPYGRGPESFARMAQEASDAIKLLSPLWLAAPGETCSAVSSRSS